MPSAQYEYGSAFLDLASRSARHSSAQIINALQDYLTIKSVLDVGCATGSWLRAWQDTGIEDFHGIDGPYVDKNKLAVSPSHYTALDLGRSFDLGRTYDLVQSLEVAEHLPPNASEEFVTCLARHAERFVLFSAAPPGQGGEFHVNERPYKFWRGLFEERGFVTADFVRPLISHDATISYWYRYNTFLFARRELFASLPDQIRRAVLPAGTAIPDVSPPLFRLRKAVLRAVPSKVQDKLARLKSAVLPTRRF
jgi:SAM-dependent methyltransferase